jgi:hypothetical protein
MIELIQHPGTQKYIDLIYVLYKAVSPPVCASLRRAYHGRPDQFPIIGWFTASIRILQPLCASLLWYICAGAVQCSAVQCSAVQVHPAGNKTTAPSTFLIMA